MDDVNLKITCKRKREREREKERRESRRGGGEERERERIFLNFLIKYFRIWGYITLIIDYRMHIIFNIDI